MKQEGKRRFRSNILCQKNSISNFLLNYFPFANRILYGERWANQHFASETLGFYAILILLLAVRVFLHDRAALLRYLDVDDMARKKSTHEFIVN